MPTERVSLSVLRHISARAAAILDRYMPDKAAGIPAEAFRQFIYTLCWGNFADLDLHLLEGLAPPDRSALLEELRCYHDYLRRQRERVDRFHHAYRDWLDERESQLPREHLERLRHWRQRYGTYAYFRITGLSTKRGFQHFIADPAGCMAAFEQAFADLAKQRERERAWQEEAGAGWHSSGQYFDEQNSLSAQLEQALLQLGVSPGTTFAQIRQAYRTHAKKLHPDWQGENLTAQMAALNVAYELLCKFYRPIATESRGPET
jgi:hypothetical protein